MTQKNNKLAKIAFGLGIFALVIQLLLPIIVILCFAVSPIQFFTGERAVAGFETTTDSFVCPMGIEWRGGSQKYLKLLGTDHASHAQHKQSANPTDHHNHHAMHHTQPADTAESETPQPCPIEKLNFLNKKFNTHLLFIAFFAFIIFAFLWIIPQKQYQHILKRFLFYLSPPRQAPPVMVF